jgi:diguanylate cyclase (GGDEF)-like protein
MVVEDTEIGLLRQQLAAAQSKIRILEAQLTALADHDPLTDLPNRPSMEQAIEDHLNGCIRYGPAGALLIVGLDGLGQVDETHGPLFGDELRVRIAEAVRDRLRTTDLVCRWSDDELAVLLPRSTRHEVQVVANTLLEVVSTRGDAAGLGASVGVAFVIADETADELVVRSSMAMLAARKKGGGRTVIDAQRQSHLLWLSRSRQRMGGGAAPLA